MTIDDVIFALEQVKDAKGNLGVDYILHDSTSYENILKVSFVDGSCEKIELPMD